MKGLFLLCFCLIIISCDNKTPKPKVIEVKKIAVDGKYLLLNKGLYKSIDFIDNKNVVVEDNILHISYTVPYTIKNDKLYIQAKEATLIYDISNGILLIPSANGNGPYREYIGVFAKEAFYPKIVELIKKEEAKNKLERNNNKPKRKKKKQDIEEVIEDSENWIDTTSSE